MAKRAGVVVCVAGMLAISSPGASGHTGEELRDVAPSSGSQAFVDGGSCSFSTAISVGARNFFWAQPVLACENVTTTLYATIIQSISTIRFPPSPGEGEPTSTTCSITGTATCNGPYYEGYGPPNALIRSHATFVISYPHAAPNGLVSPWCTPTLWAGVNGSIRYRCHANAYDASSVCVFATCQSAPTAGRSRD